MEFIEDERRRGIAKHIAQVHSAERGKEESRKQAAEIALHDEMREKGKQQFEQSGLGGMLDELGMFGSHEKVFKGSNRSDGIYYIDITIMERFGHGIEKYVDIGITADGTITFKGGEIDMWVRRKGVLGFGYKKITAPLEIVIAKNEWKGNNGLETLEDALEKAYRSPRIVYRSEPEHHRDGG